MPLVAAAYFLIELIAFFLIGKWIGFGWALILLIALFIAGMAVSAWQLRALTERVATQTNHPGKLTADAALTVVGAFLVAVPGIVSTVCGLLLMLPPTRALTRKLIGASARRALANFGGSAFTTVTQYGAPGSKNIPGWGEVIDHREDEAPRGPRNNSSSSSDDPSDKNKGITE
ncbi:FxsA family protein [Corynebacterium anserum]|uniref:FxsA family protein n=1 Tax=Corynebacterium anserum TaxID=2684406 RepID=A0A7G7YNB2_9CORY|nr:FxsA family protein [Corynebacterium anserum]MBC2681535.1 FxsA family protein [Corynebacterium anserum]QNH95982.1 FxsA family protein [Corynebacterium anserum]